MGSENQLVISRRKQSYFPVHSRNVISLFCVGKTGNFLNTNLDADSKTWILHGEGNVRTHLFVFHPR